MAADLAQEQRERVGRAARQVADEVVRRRDLLVPAVVVDLQAARARLLLDLALGLVVEVQARDERGDVVQAELALLLGGVEHGADGGALRVVQVHTG